MLQLYWLQHWQSFFWYLQLLQSVTWKRYNDFKKLHKAMFSLHKALHRREEFPPFVKAQLFSG